MSLHVGDKVRIWWVDESNDVVNSECQDGFVLKDGMVSFTDTSEGGEDESYWIPVQGIRCIEKMAEPEEDPIHYDLPDECILKSFGGDPEFYYRASHTRLGFESENFLTKQEAIDDLVGQMQKALDDQSECQGTADFSITWHESSERLRRSGGEDD